MGDRKGIRPVKIPASKHLGMAVNITGRGTASGVLTGISCPLYSQHCNRLSFPYAWLEAFTWPSTQNLAETDCCSVDTDTTAADALQLATYCPTWEYLQRPQDDDDVHSQATK